MAEGGIRANVDLHEPVAVVGPMMEVAPDVLEVGLPRRDCQQQRYREGIGASRCFEEWEPGGGAVELVAELIRSPVVFHAAIGRRRRLRLTCCDRRFSLWQHWR